MGNCMKISWGESVHICEQIVEQEVEQRKLDLNESP
jgi:hypothetical protein